MERPDALDPAWFDSLLTGSADTTGLLYRRARYPDPLTQIDPIGPQGGLNLYRDTSRDPTKVAPRGSGWVAVAAVCSADSRLWLAEGKLIDSSATVPASFIAG